MISRYLLLYLVSASLFTVQGCASLQKEDSSVRLESQLGEVKQTQTALKARLDELNNKLFVIEDRIKENAREIQDIKSLAIPSPPSDIKVIKVAPQEDRVAETTAKDKEGLTKPQSPDELYEKGYTLFAEGRAEKVREVFGEFLRNFPKHPLSDNAQYWIGETYYTEKNYARALEEFQRVVDNYPEENKAPDALLKIALSYIELADKEKARDALNRLIEAYPSSEAARIAEKTLLKITR